MSNLHRALAPIDESAWREIDEEARRTLKRILAGRRLVDFTGPDGYGRSSVGRGRVDAIEPLIAGTTACLRKLQPFVEQRVDFELRREEIEAIGRGAKDADLDPVTKAAQLAALAEDTAIFSGYAEAGIRGIMELADAHAVGLSTNYERYPVTVASALTWLRNQGISGPYALALGPRCYQGLTETTNKGGYPILDLVRQQIDGGIIWAPAIDGALLISRRGGDFELYVGRDFAIGYTAHGRDTVQLFLESSFTFLVHTADAAVSLRYEGDARAKAKRRSKRG